MKVSKVWKLVGACAVILLSVLVSTWAGGCWHQEVPEDNEDRLQKAYRLTLELKYEEAYGNFRVARTLAHIEGDSGRELKALKGMADCAFWMGEVDSCIHRYNQALVLAREQNAQLEEYDIYTKLKQAYMAKVDMKNVMLVDEKTDSLMNATDNKKIQMNMQQRLAVEAMQQQNYQLAEHYFLVNEGLLDSLSEQDRLLAKYTVYGYLRDFYLGQQNYTKARKYSKLYIENGKKGFGLHQLAYMCYDTEAIICAEQKDRRAAFAALDSMRYGLTLTQGASEVNAMHYYDVKARVHAIFEEWDNACREYKKALAEVENTRAAYRVDYFRIVNLLGIALFRCKKYDEARACFSDYARYCKLQFGEESLTYADALCTMANLEGYSGNTEAGKQYYIKSVGICERLVAEQLKYISVQERNAFWNSFAPKMWAMTAYAMKTGERKSVFTEKCYDALLFSKALLLESDRAMAAAINDGCTSEEQQTYYKMQAQQKQLKGLMNDYDKNKTLIDELHRKISKQNQKLTPIISRLGYTSFLRQTSKDIKQSYFTDYKSDEEVQQFACFVVDKKQTYPKLVKSFTEEDIKILLKGNPADFLYKEPYASKAVNIIWKPLAKEVNGKKTIYYVPSGLLHRIALESLPLSDGSLLGEHYHFVRLTSAREIAKLKSGKQMVQKARATLYGALEYDVDTVSMLHEASHYKIEPLIAFNRGETVRGEKRFRELPNAKEEIESIERILKGRHMNVTSHTGKEGTEESFVALSGKAPQILHVATHGFYYTQEKAKSVNYLNGYQDAMLLSGLIMAGGNRAWTGKQLPKGVLGGVLTANSIASLNLKGTDLLVLSACQTGLGVATPEGLFGLQRAFKKAGVQTMVMTLWSVDDEATKDFMIRFYEELSVNQWNKRAAFEKTKEFIRSKTYIRNGKSYKGDPYYWAAFVMLD